MFEKFPKSEGISGEEREQSREIINRLLEKIHNQKDRLKQIQEGQFVVVLLEGQELEDDLVLLNEDEMLNLTIWKVYKVKGNTTIIFDPVRGKEPLQCIHKEVHTNQLVELSDLRKLEKYFPEELIIRPNNNDNTEQGYTIEISERDKRLFEILDKFGEIGKQLLLQFFDQYIPKTFTKDNLNGNFDITPELDNIEENLTTQQKEFLASVLEQIKQDHEELTKILSEFDKDDLLLQLGEILFEQDKDKTLDSNKMSVVVVPGGVALLIHDRDYFSKKFKKSEHVSGFYRRNIQYTKKTRLSGRIFVVDTTNVSADETFRHEYFHLLTDHYIEPHEISVDQPADYYANRKQQHQLDERRTKLLVMQLNKQSKRSERKIYVEDSEELAIRQKMNNIEEEIVELHVKEKEIIDNSENYFSYKASRLFRDIRDELGAHAISGRFNTREETLINRNTTWYERVNQISHENDRIKFVEQWKKFKSVISFCEYFGVTPNNALPIFLTSQNFEQMTKRLALLTQEYQTKWE